MADEKFDLGVVTTADIDRAMELTWETYSEEAKRILDKKESIEGMRRSLVEALEMLVIAKSARMSR